MVENGSRKLQATDYVNYTHGIRVFVQNECYTKMYNK